MGQGESNPAKTLARRRETAVEQNELGALVKRDTGAGVHGKKQYVTTVGR